MSRPEPHLSSLTLEELVERLDQMIAKAKLVPLTDQVRMDKEELYELVDHMRVRLRDGERGPGVRD